MKKLRPIFVLVALSACLSLTSCDAFRSKAANTPEHSKMGQSDPLTNARVGTDKATEISDKASAAVAEHERKNKALIKANVSAARAENKNNPEGSPKIIVDGELSIAESRLADTEVDKDELIQVSVRKALVESGKASAAAAAYGDAVKQAENQLSLLIQTREELARALAQRDAARDAEKKQADAFLETIKNNKAQADKVLSDLRAAHEKEMEIERKAFNRKIGGALIGLACLLFLTGAFLTYSGVQSGDLFKAITKGAVFVCFAAAALALAWTINQPWFKYVIWISGALALAAICVFFWLSWREAQEKREKEQRSHEADEAEKTLKIIGSVLDPLPDEHPVKETLRKRMSDNHKALVTELKAEVQRERASSV